MAPTTPSAHPKPIILTGPSGSGKSTIKDRLFAEFPDRFGFSVSHTTRQPRARADGTLEEDGVEYYFVSRPEFEDLMKSGKMLEHAQFGSNLYGTSEMAVERVRAQGRICFLDIEMEGVKSCRRIGLTDRIIFLRPPSHEVLEQRLRGRGTDKEEHIKERLEKAHVEMEFSEKEGSQWGKVIVNDELEKAYGEVKDLVVGWLKEDGKL